MSVAERFGQKPLCSSGRILNTLAVVTDGAGDNPQENPTGVCHQRDTLVFAALYPVRLLVDHLDSGTFLVFQNLLPHGEVDVDQSMSQGGIAVKGDLELLVGNFIRSNSLPVCQKANGIYQFLHCVLDFRRCLCGQLVDVFGNVWVELQ